MRRDDCRWFLAVSACVLLSALLVSGFAWVAASPAVRATVMGTLRTDRVEIRMSLPSEGNAAVLATGSEVRSDAEVENRGIPVWIRAAVAHSVSGGEVGNIEWSGGERCLSEDWLSAPDGWWYYAVPLETHAAATFAVCMYMPIFEQVAVGDSFEWKVADEPLKSAGWSTPSPDPFDAPDIMAYSGAAGGTVRETITVEAIQARNFSPDFASGDPWGSTRADYSCTQGEERG